MQNLLQSRERSLAHSGTFISECSPLSHCIVHCTIFTFLITDELPLSAALYGVYILSSGTPENCSILFSVGPEYAVETSFLHWPSL